MKRSRRALALSLVALSFAFGQTTDQADKSSSTAELAKLKAQLEAQQKEIEQLSAMLAAQKKEIDQVTATPVRMLPNLGSVASTTPALPPAPPVPAPRVLDPQVPAGDATAPLQLKVGDATIQPIGFMDLTAVWKSENAGGNIGSNFGNVPFNNSTAAHLPEFRFSPQNSRIGFRIDANVKGAHVMAYNEFDFLGTSGANNLSVTNGAFVPRLRLFWVNIKKGQWEFLAGQSWSMLTPNRKGISALPGDLFYSQATDVNYIAGLTWTRQPGVRFIFHPTDKVAFGLSLENPDAYSGGANGSTAFTPPTALAGLLGSQIDNQTNVQSTPNLHPDIIAKLAFDPSSHVHFEVAGIERTFRIWNPNTNTIFTKAGGGGSINGNFEIVKNFRLVTNNYWSDGGGRYLFGNAPDLVLRSSGSISPVHSGGAVEGFEATVGKVLLYGYYGAIYTGKNVSLDTTGNPVGWGFRGSSNGQDRYIQEITVGFNQTIWKDSKWGAINLMGQYEYLFREPWFVAANAPKQAHDSTIYLNIRYSLPGAAPSAK